MEQTDAALVGQARTGEPDAFRVLVERHARSLFGLAYRMTGNESDAEDVVQESFLRAYRQLKSFDQRASFGTWLYRIAVNCSLDLVRSRGRRMEVFAPAGDEAVDPVAEAPSASPGPECLALSGEIRQRVAAGLRRLSPTERAAFVLRHFEGMRIEEMSRVLGCQPGAARHSVFRAVQKLRRALEPALSTVK
jgi:RNA polymerase sigma-70 factor (ECF subfamily)